MKQLIQRRKAIEPYYSTKLGRLYCGDVLATLKSLPSESAQCCVTSPPYWGLRDYGTATWVGGNINCEHKAPPRSSTIIKGSANKKSGPNQIEQFGDQFWGDCPKCGAKRIDNQIGLEKTPEEYVIKMVKLFKEFRRVLKSDGTLWLNLGDSYNAYKANTGDTEYTGISNRPTHRKKGHGLECKTLKPKDLVGIPWMVAFALRADGWYLRQEIIWSKPNPMPEAVKDRCTKSHESLFLLSKNQKYYYDADAISEKTYWNGKSGDKNYRPGIEGGRIDSGMNSGGEKDSRNKRSVWTINTEPYPEAHFATFPLKLIEPCIRAGTKKGDTVLDPFMGSGTTGYLCEMLDRKWIGIELNQKYCDLAKKRINQEALKPKLL